MNEERTGEFLQQMEHIRDHLLCRYSIAVNNGDDRKIFEEFLDKDILITCFSQILALSVPYVCYPTILSCKLYDI
jgi:hypothetical protein